MPNRYLLRLACYLLPATSWLSGLSQPLPPRPAPLPDRLLSLVAPPELRASTQRILAAVYPFQITSDQQVQDRNQPQATLASRYTDVLFRALQSSGWFMPVEPGNMGNLLNGQAAAPTGSTVALAGTNTAPPATNQRLCWKRACLRTIPATYPARSAGRISAATGKGRTGWTGPRCTYG